MAKKCKTITTAQVPRRAASARRPKRTLVDHILSGPAWPDELVETINDRSQDPDRDIVF